LCMKAVVLHGSPRRGRNSDTLVEHFLRGLSESGVHEVAHFYLNELGIRPCQGCLGCAEPPHDCVILDDMTGIYEAYKAADLVVWATPMYWGYLTAQMKTVQDRMEALAWSGFGGKVFAVIVTFRHHFESAVGMFERICPYFDVELHTLVCRTYDPETGVDIPIERLPGKLEEAYRLGRELSR
jgi:multimeric flavodoxin WrbA